MTSALDELDDLAVTSGEPTPQRIFRASVARERFDRVARLRDVLGRPPLGLVAAYSLKTNPRAELLAMARERGFCAECISHDEVDWAARNGFAPAQSIYNGPKPFAADPPSAPLGCVFADSLEALARNLARGAALIQGIRLRPSMINSRFGVPLEDEATLAGMLAATPLETVTGVSFHVRREDLHGASWRDAAEDVLQRAAALARASGRRIGAFDVGGGWTPDDFDQHFHADMRWLVDRLVAHLPDCTQLIFEPGQALCTPTEALLAEVLELRDRRGRREAIVDLAYSDWPSMHAYVHGYFARCGERWERIGPGPDRIGGRTCLEYDLVEGLRLPRALAAGDRLLVTNTGSYDHSMAFTFARGER